MQQETDANPGPPSPQRQLGLDHLTKRIAQALFEARGCVEGHELDDWLKAESLVEALLSDLAQTAGTQLSLSLADLEQRKAFLQRPSWDPLCQPWRA